MYRRSVLALPLLLAAPGCVTSGLELPPMSDDRIKSVVIVSAFTDTVQLKYLPAFWFTVFVSAEDKFEDTNWRLDDHIRTRLAARLRGTCAIKTVVYDPADMAGAESAAQTVERLKKVVPAGLADAIIFVVPSRSKQDDRKLAHSGVGLSSERNPLVGVGSAAFAYSLTGIFDGRTFETIAWRAGAIAPSSFDVPPPFERLPFQYTGGGMASLSEEQRTQLRDAIFRLLDNTITFTFSLHLGGLNKVSNEIPGMAAGEFAELQARDARRWNAVMARLRLDVAV